ncbi:MAG TPA: RNA polymerase sigma factor [Kofleriaceae bacterium]|nr:RNA polymerase sigma factor [Kofleriaceae bacterium]
MSPVTRHALEQQLAHLHARTFGWAMAACDYRRDDALDVVQTTYLKVLDGRARFSGRSSFTTWLFAVVRQTAVDLRRRRSLRAELLRRWLPRADAAPPPPAGDDRVGEQVRRALAALPRRQREVAELVFYQDLTIEEAAEVMAVSLGSARTHYDRAKRSLARTLAELVP